MNLSLSDVNQLNLLQVVQLSSVVIGEHNSSHFGDKWLELNGRHYIMQKIFENVGLNFQVCDELIDALILDKGKISDEDILRCHTHLFDFIIHYEKSVTKYMKRRSKLKKYLDYEPSKYLVLKLSKLGIEFEQLVGEILTELNINYIQYDSGKRNCKPDFVFSEKHWGDAKISEHTVFHSQTIDKYEKHIDKLTIIYLRKTSQLEWRRYVTPKTEIVHISYFVKELPIDKRQQFEDRLSKIENSLIRSIK